MYLRQRCSDGSVNKTILKPLIAAAARWQYVYVGFSWRKIPHSTAYTVSEKAIRFQHPDYNPDRTQKLISSSMSWHLSTRNISSKSTCAFLSYLANRHRSDTFTFKCQQGSTHELWQTQLSPPLSEVKNKWQSVNWTGPEQLAAWHRWHDVSLKYFTLSPPMFFIARWSAPTTVTAFSAVEAVTVQSSPFPSSTPVIKMSWDFHNAGNHIITMHLHCWH